MKTTAEKIEVMKAFMSGKTIQRKYENQNWEDATPTQSNGDLEWDWGTFDYRVKGDSELID